MRTASSLAAVIGSRVSAKDIVDVLSRAARHHTSGRTYAINYYFEPVLEILAKYPALPTPMLRDRTLRQLDVDYAASKDKDTLDHVKSCRKATLCEATFGIIADEKRVQLKELLALAANRSTQPIVTSQRIADISYPVFEFDRKSKKPRQVGTVRLSAVPVTIKGDWVTFEHEGVTTRKKISGKGFTIVFKDQPEESESRITGTS